MFHHAVMEPDDFARADELLGLLAGHRNVVPRTLAELLQPLHEHDQVEHAAAGGRPLGPERLREAVGLVARRAALVAHDDGDAIAGKPRSRAQSTHAAVSCPRDAPPARLAARPRWR